MNPFTWLFIALLSMDAVRELMGMSSVLGMWGTAWPASGHASPRYFRRLCKQAPVSSAASSISAINPPTPFQP